MRFFKSMSKYFREAIRDISFVKLLVLRIFGVFDLPFTQKLAFNVCLLVYLFGFESASTTEAILRPFRFLTNFQTFSIFGPKAAGSDVTKIDIINENTDWSPSNSHRTCNIDVQ